MQCAKLRFYCTRGPYQVKTDKFVSNCIDIALHHGFQGWLVNIENVVREDLVPALIDMVAMLADGIRQRLGEEGMVLWYDSVTVKVFFSQRWRCFLFVFCRDCNFS